MERVTGHKPEGVAAGGFIHLINSGATALDGTGAATNEQGEHVMKHFWEMTEQDIQACLGATDWCRANYEYFRGGGFSSHFRCTAEMPVTMLRVNIVEGVGPVLQLAEGWTANLPDEIHDSHRPADGPDLAHHLVCAPYHRQREPSGMFTASWPIGAPTTASPSTATWART